MKIVVFLAILVGTQSVVGEAAPLTNEDVVALTRAGIGDAVIVAKIEGARANFDVSVESLVALKEGGVSEVVMAAMVAASRGTPTKGAHPAEAGEPPIRSGGRMTSTEVGALAQAWSDALLAINKAASAATADPTPLAVSGQVSAMADHADVLLKHPSPRAECNDIARELKELLVDARDGYAGLPKRRGNAEPRP